MKISLFIVIGIVSAGVIAFFLFPNAYAEESSLKQQLAENLSLTEISCPNSEHVLIQRSNEKLACVNPYTMAKLEWNPVDISLWSKIIRFEQPFAIFTHLSKTGNVQSVKYYEEMNSITIHVISDKPEKLSVNVNRAILETPTENCEIPEWSNYFVLINGEEVAYENKLTTDHYRYLEINVDLPSPSGEYTMRGASERHAYYDIPFDEDSMVIEIIGTCLI